MSTLPGWPLKRSGFPGIWLDRMRAYVDAHTGSAAPGAPVALTVHAPATVGSFPPVASPTGTGDVRLNGGINLAGPVGGGDELVMTVPDTHRPERFGMYPVVGIMVGAPGPGPAAEPIPVALSVQSDGGAYLSYPDIPEFAVVNVSIDTVTYWPAG